MRRSALACALALTALMAPAAAAYSKPDYGPLSDRLGQIAVGLGEHRSNAARSAALDLAPRGPGSLTEVGGRVLVEARFLSGALSHVETLRRAGLDIVDTSRRYETLTLAATPSQLELLAGTPGIEAVTEVIEPFGGGVARAGTDRAASRRLNTCRGQRTSEGDTQLRAEEARRLFDVDGTGVGVGVLSDSFANNTGTPAATWAGDIATGDLPGPGNPCGRTLPVARIDDTVAGRDEGRAMAQIVHDIAPGAHLSFATANSGMLNFANNIRALRATGNRVIVDDYVYAAEPFYQDGPISVAVNEVVASGATYVTLAHNNNVRSGGLDLASWEALSYRPMGCPAPLPNPTCMDFDPSGAGLDNAYDMVVGPGARLSLSFQWAQPWDGVTSDFDIYLLSAGGSVLASGTSINPTSGRPSEFFSWANPAGVAQAVRIVIARYDPAGTDTAFPRMKFVQMGNSSQASVVTMAQYATSAGGGDVIGPAIFGHDGAASAITTAAIAPSTTTEPYASSSRGPATLLFGPVTGTGPAAPLPSPLVISKPDITATHCTANTFFGTPTSSGFRFCGTSAAAPHAAGVAALQHAEVPGATTAQIRAALTATARPIGSFPATTVGAGLIQSPQAIDLLTPTPRVTITSGPTGRVREDRPRFRFSSDGPDSFECSFDGGPAGSCSPGYRPRRPLSDGGHRFTVTAIDLVGRRVSASRSFRVDTTGPTVRFKAKPPARTRSRRARFAFKSERGAAFRCKLDGKPFRSCSSPKTFSVGRGAHKLVVRARDRVGNLGPAKTHRWKVSAS